MTHAVCKSCGKRYKLDGFDPSRAYQCRHCKGPLVPA
jgi:hypothetical protein